MFEGKIATEVATMLFFLCFDTLWGALQPVAVKINEVSQPGENFWNREMATNPKKSALKLPKSC